MEALAAALTDRQCREGKGAWARPSGRKLAGRDGEAPSVTGPSRIADGDDVRGERRVVLAVKDDVKGQREAQADALLSRLSRRW